MIRVVSTALVAAAMITCGPSIRSVGSAPSPSAFTASALSASPLILHAMSIALHAEPRYRLVFEGGEAGSFTELRLLGTDGSVIAASAAVPRTSEGLEVCSGSKSERPPGYGAVRASISLASPEQLSDIIEHPNDYRVEVFTHGVWQPMPFVFECHAQE